MGTATLLGTGWGPWRGGWQSSTTLQGDSSGWTLLDAGRAAGRWTTFDEAVQTLWPTRASRGCEPWAVGWLSYEAAASGGHLPSRCAPDDGIQGSWLIEPRPMTRVPRPAAGNSVAGRIASSLSDAAFQQGVQTILERIAAGDFYQVNLTRRFRIEPWQGGLDPLLRAASNGDGAPKYLSWFEFAAGELVCASMEMLLRRRGELLETRPIKGTRPRGATPEEDQHLAVELENDPKERSELAMVVDLERNDLSRVAEVGSVRVADPGQVQTYPSVLHRVARVTAQVAPELEWWQVLAVMAPGGSVTGCPKRSAMQCIAALETVPRGPYTGVLGLVTGGGDLELALPIRTAWRIGDRLEFAAGCGIVWGSDPEREEAESRLKVAPWLDLVL